MENDDLLEDKGIGPVKEGFRGQPQGLMTLFFSEMWERFCYYGMRTLLTLYLVKSLMKGDAEASLIYGAYTGLIYAAPILGGRMADKYLGYRYAVILGGILMAIGEFLILGGTEHMLLIGMGALIIGNGYFKANISTIVGKLYNDNDPRRDSGFTIFYIGINLGALGATTLVAYVGETYGFHYGFALAGIGMLLGILIFWNGRNQYNAAEGLEITEAGRKKLFGSISMVQAISIGSLLLIPLCYLLIVNNHVLNLIFLGLFVYVAYNLISSGAKEGKMWRDRMIALVIFMLINTVFWACFEQAGTSLTLFADRNVSRDILGWTMPASMTQFFNPFFIILFGSIFSVMWVKLSKIGKNPSIPLKFALGIFQLGLGFLITLIGYKYMDSSFQVPLLTLVFLYMLHTTGELFLSPIGLSMVTKLAPKHIAGTAMGAWFLSFAMANLLGGQIATLTSADGHAADKVETEGFSLETTVTEAFVIEGSEGLNLETWPEISEDFPKNITYGKFLDIQDWVEMREGLSKGVNTDEWLVDRSLANPTMDPKDWLVQTQWESLSARYKRIASMDKAAEDAGSATAGMSMKDWLYYRDGMMAIDDKSLSLSKGVAISKLARQEEGLEKYTKVFSTLGYVLLAFALLIAILNRPLKKLMHGVE